MELFELMISKFREEMRGKLTWEVESCFKGRVHTKNIYRLGEFTIEEYFRPKRTPKVFFGKVNISAEFFILPPDSPPIERHLNIENIKENIENDIIGTLELHLKNAT